MRTIRGFLLATTVTIMGAGSVQGQVPASTGTVAMVSRMCLWNADKAMWKKVGLSKAQMNVMEVLKARYPAVVEGQWVSEDAPLQPTPYASANGTVPAGSGSSSATESLQAEVLEVLTPRQVNKWMALCTGTKAPQH